MSRSSPERTLEERIVEAALLLAAERGWENVRLHEVAEALGVPLVDVARRLRDPDAIANAWFARAREELLRLPVSMLEGRSPPERLETAMMRWLDAFSAHRGVTGQMLGQKLYPTHPHHWVPMIFDLSRLIHDFLDAARIKSTGRRRQLAEIGLTLIFLRSLRIWLRDESAGRERTRAFLHARLASADRWMARLR